MNVYHLYPRPDAPHLSRDADHGGWDIARGFIVIAENETQARGLVGQRTAGRDWYDAPSACGGECQRGVCLDEAGEGYMRRPETVDGPCVWRDPTETECVQIATGADGEPRIVLRDYCAG